MTERLYCCTPPRAGATVCYYAVDSHMMHTAHGKFVLSAGFRRFIVLSSSFIVYIHPVGLHRFYHCIKVSSDSENSGLPFCSG